MSALRDRDPFRLGLITAAVLAILLLATLSFGALGLGQTSYQAEFAHVGGLRPGDEVRVAGMGVGEVTGTRLAGDHVVVDFRLRDLRLGAGTTATIKLATLLGSRAMELRPAGEAPLPGGVIPLAHTTVPFDLQKVLETGTPLIEELDAESFAKAVGATSANLRDNGPRLAQALDGLSRLSDVIVTRREQIGNLITSVDGFSTLLDERKAKIFALMGQSDVLLSELLERRELIRGVLRELEGFTGQLRDLLAENDQQFGPLLANAADLTEILRRNDDAIDRALELLAPAGRYLNNALGNGPYLDVFLPYSLVPDNVLCQAKAVEGCK